MAFLEDYGLGAIVEPAYNIRTSVTSRKGYKHSAEAIDKMKQYIKEHGSPRPGKQHTLDAKKRISEKTKGYNHPMFGKTHTNTC